MANSFITIQEIARAALPRLIENLVFPNLVYKDFSNDFSRNLGDTIQVRKPVLLEAKEFDQSVGTTAQDIVETSVPVTLDKIATVDVEITAIQGATNINDLQRQVLEPAAVALAQKINSDGLALYKDIPYICGTAGTAPSTLKDLADVRRVLNANKAPVSPRYAVWDTAADASLVTIPAIVNAEKSGSTQALREGSLGRVMGLDNYMSQGIHQHTTGITSASAVKVNGAVTAGATTLAIDGTALVGKLVKGDVLTIDGKNYVVTERKLIIAVKCRRKLRIYPHDLKELPEPSDEYLRLCHLISFERLPVFHVYPRVRLNHLVTARAQLIFIEQNPYCVSFRRKKVEYCSVNIP